MPYRMIDVIADHTGAVVAGGVSSVGALAFAAGQVPVPAGLPPELAWAAVTFGPPLAWLSVRLLHVAFAYVRERRKQHAARHAMLIAAGKAIDDAEVVRQLDERDRFAALEAVLGPKSDGDK